MKKFSWSEKQEEVSWYDYRGDIYVNKKNESGWGGEWKRKKWALRPRPI